MPKAPAATTPPVASRSVTVPTDTMRPTSKGKAKTGAPAAPAKAAPGSRKVTVPGPEDLKHAQEDALLQLKIGRSAHLYTVLVSGALAIDGILLLFFYPNLPNLGPHQSGTLALEHSFFLLLPLVAGLLVAGVGLATKWEAFQLWPWEPHFSTTVAAVAGNVLLAIVYALRVVAVGPFAQLNLFPWFYAVELLGISVAVIGFTLTWTGWSSRQWMSAIAALLPIATAGLVYLPPPTTSGVSEAFAVSLFLSAIFYQTSGSFLHLISSGTRVHERELITSGQSKMFRYADEIRQREDAVRFREAATGKREVEIENSILSIQRQNDSLKEARGQLDALEEDYRKRSDSVSEKERSWAGQLAEMDSKARLVEDKTKALELREQEIGRLLPQISTREQRLVEREGEQTKRDVGLTQREQELARRDAGLKETEGRLEGRRKELEQKTQDLLRREGEVIAQGAAVGAAAGAAVGNAKSAGQDLAFREAKLEQFKAVLDEQNAQLGKKARDLIDRAKTVEEGLKRAADKEAGLAAREATVRQREIEIVDLTKDATDRRARYEAASRDYESRLEEYGRKSAAVAQKGTEADQRLRSVTEREGALGAREERLKATSQGLERRERDLAAREVALRDAEAEVSLRRQAAGRGELSFVGPAAAEGAGPAAATSRRERLVVPAAGRGAVRDVSGSLIDPASETDAETLTQHATRRHGDRLPTGTPRLDDLLLGGIPPKGHVVVLGDAFVGKEVVLYTFIAEGLKRGEPAVLVTAARSPAEVSQSLGVVLPQFREYEQMGMVHWIDASGSGATPDAHHIVLKSSDDRAGILSNLVQTATRLDGGKSTAFRVGFFGLAAVLAHGEERASFSFLQNVVGILKPRNALAAYSLEAGALSEAQVETLLSRMDGAILFRQDRDRLLLSVQGFGDVETRDWVECRVTPRALIVGSFALERIR